MRRHSVWYRALVAVWGMWLAVALCEPMELHACPMHDGMAGMASMAGMAGMSAGPRAQPQAHESQAPAAFAVCTCITCCGANSVAAPEPSLVLLAPVVVARRAMPHSAAAWPRIEREYALPFGTAPPAAASLI